MSKPIFVVAALVLLGGAGCAETFARHGTRAVLAEAKQSDKPRAMIEGAARSGAVGAFEELTTAERQEVLTQLSHDVAGAAARGMHAELSEAIGTGNGPLAQAMGNVAERVSRSVIFPECGDGPGRAACLHAQLERITQSTAAGLARALRAELGLPALVVAFVAGILCTLFVVFVVSTLRMKQEVSGWRRGGRAAGTA
jgi:hypothetical protein